MKICEKKDEDADEDDLNDGVGDDELQLQQLQPSESNDDVIGYRDWNHHLNHH